MNRFISTVALAVAVLAVAAGCGQSASEDPSAGVSGQALVVSPGVTVTSATYRVTGPGGFNSVGTVAVGDSADVPVALSGLPVASGYRIGLSATASDGTTVCVGNNTFDVTTAGTVTVVVHLTCGVPTGNVQLMGNANVCPVLDSLEAIPSETRVGGHVVLNALAHDPDNGPNSLSYRWRANGKGLTGQNASSLTFTCTSAGSIAVDANGFDGDPNCTDVLTVNLTCSP